MTDESKPSRTIVSRGLHEHLASTLMTSRNVRIAVEVMLRFATDEPSRKFVQGLLDATGQITEALDPDVLDRAALSVHINRNAIVDSVGCDVYGQLDYIVRILDMNEPDRNERVRKELLTLLKCFPSKEKT